MSYWSNQRYDDLAFQKAQQEAEALNRFSKKTTQKCSGCGGTGRSYAPIYDDPVIGYADNGPCNQCHGAGEESL